MAYPTNLASPSDTAATTRCCRHCGGSLDRWCPRCGSAVEPTASFCGTCGSATTGGTPTEPLLSREVRRTISVLFADIVGFTALADSLAPEAVRALQVDYFGRVTRVIRDWEGVVEKYIGDAVMAVFGVTTSDTFGAYRAVRAGLQIQEAVNGRLLSGGIVVHVRVGVATGEAVVDLDALRDTSYALVSGSVVTLAARVQEYSAAGSVTVTAATRNATGSLLSYRALPPIHLRGVPRPQEIWCASDAVAEPVVAPRRAEPIAA